MRSTVYPASVEGVTDQGAATGFSTRADGLDVYHRDDQYRTWENSFASRCFKVPLSHAASDRSSRSKRSAKEQGVKRRSRRCGRGVGRAVS